MLSGIQCAACDFACQQSQFLIVADEEGSILSAVSLCAIIVRVETVGIEMLAIIIFTVCLWIDVKLYRLGVFRRLYGDYSLADMIVETQSDGFAFIGQSRGDIFAINLPYTHTAFRYASRRQ